MGVSETMDFFSRQEAARARTVFLVLAFIAAVVVIILLCYGAVCAFYYLVIGSFYQEWDEVPALDHGKLCRSGIPFSPREGPFFQPVWSGHQA